MFVSGRDTVVAKGAWHSVCEWAWHIEGVVRGVAQWLLGACQYITVRGVGNEIYPMTLSRYSLC